LRRSLLILAVVACSADKNSPGGSAGLVTAFDSTADTIVARVDGQVPVSALRSMTLTMRIAPAIDDTSLFSEVADFEVDKANRLWVWDYQAKRLFLFDSAGTLVRRIGRQGAGPGEFSQGNGMVALADTGIAILDASNARISFFTANGDFRTSLPVPSGFSTGNGLMTDRSQALYLRRPVTPAREGEILGRMGLVRLKADGAFGDSLAPVDLPVNRDTYLAISPDGNGKSSTSSSFAPNYFWDWHPEGFFVAGHGGRYEVVIERKGAKPVVIRRTAPPVPILPDERSEEKERITWNMRQTQPGWTWNGPEIPENKAPLAGILIARDGNIWVRVASPSERIPDAELPLAGEKKPGGKPGSQAPVRHYRSPAIYEVYAPTGRFLGRVPLPPRTTLIQADGEYFWGIARDEDDLPSIVRFRLSMPFDNE
jgi:6-bladed beta-propeller protein